MIINPQCSLLGDKGIYGSKLDAGREVQYVHDIGVLMEELGLQPMGALDHPDVLPALRQAAEYVET